MCKAKHCPENHSKHYCKVCEDTDSDHCASNCPNSQTVYHGTHKKNVESIQKDGFRVSPTGRIGEGVYFALDFETAKLIAINRAGP